MRGRNGWKMRAMAWAAAIPTALLPLFSGPAEAQQKKQILKAMERPQRSELAAGKTDKLTAAQWKRVDEKRAKEAAHRPDERPLSHKEITSLQFNSTSSDAPARRVGRRRARGKFAW